MIWRDPQIFKMNSLTPPNGEMGSQRKPWHFFLWKNSLIGCWLTTYRVKLFWCKQSHFSQENCTRKHLFNCNTVWQCVRRTRQSKQFGTGSFTSVSKANLDAVQYKQWHKHWLVWNSYYFKVFLMHTLFWFSIVSEMENIHCGCTTDEIFFLQNL